MIGFGNLQNSFAWGPLSMRMALMAAGHASYQDLQTKITVKMLFKDIPYLHFRGSGKETVNCLIYDSRRVLPGSIFFAIHGQEKNGNDFIEEAIDRGAVAIVSAAPAPKFCPVDYIEVEDVRSTMAQVARSFYGQPDRSLSLIGITGTNGKTTVSMLTQYLLGGASRCGLIGTVRYDLGQRTVPSYRTTPESVDICSMFDQMKIAGCKHAVMEVSSHALDQQRVQGMEFDAVAFLNLSQDHIDYHGSMENYWAAKKKLFTGENGNVPALAIVNLDDPYAEDLKQNLSSLTRLFTFSTHQAADFSITDLKLTATNSTFQLWYENKNYLVELPLPGLYNVQNSLAALALCVGLGCELQALVDQLKLFEGVPGRMERIDCGQPFHVWVDYAHTEDALNNVLTMLRPITTGQIHTVFGCGGNRDRTKRPKMMQVVAQHSDYVWVTSDNPRSERIESIFEDMKQGLHETVPVVFLADRQAAIAAAFAKAQPGDCVLIAGKGHESYQELADTLIPFDDRLVAQALLKDMLSLS